jgi:hypothetical protein
MDELDPDPDLEEGADQEWIDEREPELFEGGDGNELPPNYFERHIVHQPHPDLSRIKRQLRAIRRRRGS